MPTNPNSMTVQVSAPPRGTPPGTQLPKAYVPAQCSLTWSWGLQPATALIDWASAKLSDTIYPQAFVTIQLGGQTFYGLMKEVTPVLGSDGITLMQQFVDLREFLAWDISYGAFNRRENKLVNGRFVRRYWHILPGDYARLRKTYTNTPYTARQILDFLFGGPTVESPWTREYDNAAVVALNHPIYELDCLSGKTLGQAVLEVSERMGTVFTTLGAAYNLYWTMKGVTVTAGGLSTAVLPAFPANSDNRRGPGLTMSGYPTRVNILGGRSLYQVLNQELEADWKAAWEAFFDLEAFTQDLFLNELTEADVGGIAAGTAYTAIPDDPDRLVGQQLAKARALTITVGQYADRREARDGTGAAWRDYRKFNGRSRLGMPVALYLKTILFRAFRPPAGWTLVNVNGLAGDVFSMELSDRALVEVTHDPVTGVMAWSTDVVSATNGYAIVQGYQVGADAFKTLRPEHFQLGQWVDSQSLWQRVEFHIDDSGEGSQFILFEEAVIVSADLLTLPEFGGTAQDYPVLHSAPTITVPRVRAALVWAAERFNYLAGEGTKDGVENVDGLTGEYVAAADGAFAVTELPYADGLYASQKAAQIAVALLNRQFYYATGGYTVQGSNATQLSSCIDRVTLSLSADGGLTEQVDYTNERSRNTTGDGRLQVMPERDFDRRESLQPFLPGQRELKVAANEARLFGLGLKQNHKLYKLVRDAFYDLLGFDQRPTTLFLDPAQVVGNALAVGTPIWREATDTLPSNPGPATDLTTPVFHGVTVLHNELDSGPVRVTPSGVDGVALVRVQGPVAVNDAVGYDAANGVADTFLVGGKPDPALGTALEAIPDPGDGTQTIKLIRVRMGGGAGVATGKKKYHFAAMFKDYFMTAEGVAVAKPFQLQGSRTGQVTLDGVTWTMTYKTDTNLAYQARRKSAIVLGSYGEFQRITPLYAVGDLIWAEQADTGLATEDGAPVAWMESQPQRMWCKRLDQSTY